MTNDRRPVAALVRDVSPRLADGELTFVARQPIDPDLARAQHGDYVSLLAGLGLEIVRLPALPALPDGVFVEDTVAIFDDLAVLTRPGAAVRRAEVASTADALVARGWRTAAITPPATLDGGDVLQVGAVVYVGLGTRTSPTAVERLRRLVARFGRRVVAVRIEDALHLKTVATALPDGTIIALPGRVDTAAFDGHEIVAVPEPEGASVVPVGGVVVVSAAAPRTADLVAKRGFDVRTVDITELEKAEAGPTCLSVLVPPLRRDGEERPVQVRSHD